MGSSLSPIRGYSYCSYNKLCFFNQWPMRVTMSWPVYWWSLWLYPYPHWQKKMSLCLRPHWRVSKIIILKSFTGKWMNVHVYLVYCSINFRSITSFYFLICQRWYIFFYFLYIYCWLQTEFMKTSNFSYLNWFSHTYIQKIYTVICLYMHALQGTWVIVTVWPKLSTR